MAAVITKFIAKNHKTTTSAHKTTYVTFWRLNAKLSNNLRRINFAKSSLADVTGGYVG